jgi:hypothetical protein
MSSGSNQANSVLTNSPQNVADVSEVVISEGTFNNENDETENRKRKRVPDKVVYKVGYTISDIERAISSIGYTINNVIDDDDIATNKKSFKDYTYYKVLHGKFSLYDKEAELKRCKGNFVDGKKDGEWTINEIEPSLNRVMSSKGTYVQDIRQGEWKYIIPDIVEITVYYTNGIITSKNINILDNLQIDLCVRASNPTETVEL